MQKITPFLWFDKQAEPAARFYTAIFKNSKIHGVERYGEGGPGPAGTVMTVCFRILGQEFLALNGGPSFKITPAISFVVNCTTQKEIDFYWRKLSAGGKQAHCGWLEDKFGVSWQVVPAVLGGMLSDKNAAKAARVMQAMLKMTKLDLKRLQQAAAAK